jgi:hypothetical protein
MIEQPYLVVDAQRLCSNLRCLEGGQVAHCFSDAPILVDQREDTNEAYRSEPSKQSKVEVGSSSTTALAKPELHQ